MKSIRGAIWLVPLAVGCMALPAQLETNSKNTGKTTRQARTMPLHFNESGPNNSSTVTTTTTSDRRNDSVIDDNNVVNDNYTDVKSSNDVDGIVASKSKPYFAGVSATISNNDGALTTSISTPTLTTTSTSTEQRPLAGTTELSLTSSPSSSSSPPPNWSIADGKTESTSSRTIASNRDASSSFLSSSKRSTTATFNEFVTTPATTSVKETRESTGKIRPQIKLTTNYTSLAETGVRLPEGASAALAKPTKYHYYPHNQHIYLLPECAVQQVCNAVYVRLNFTQPLCACPGRYRDPCSASLDSDDLHTTELVTDPRTKALTLVKTCEPVAEMRECRVPRDWSLLALQNVRTGKSHYLVICRCPDANILEGPMSHDQPTYASVPGIRVYGMMCVQGNRRGRPLRYTRSLSEDRDFQREIEHDDKGNANDRLNFPWYKVQQLMDAALWD
ncbi:unnamed protein product [Heterotrigona itama]|uniref:EGF-like domain-containing protein n=1 Tax=Heterotrigona itama TaxID=395501 RepID=A0A6V7H1I7_9HYME|nr:unnamed protein product [Heterotrigona itama]